MQGDPFEMLEKYTVVYKKLMCVSLSSMFEYEREGCPCRVNGGFTGGSAAWPYGIAKFSSVTKTQRAFRRQYNCHHVPSHRDIVKWYNMFLENGLTMPHTGGRVRDRNREEDIRQAMIQGPRKSREFLDNTCSNGP
jgi:hypothetical protein